MCMCVRLIDLCVHTYTDTYTVYIHLHVSMAHTSIETERERKNTIGLLPPHNPFHVRVCEISTIQTAEDLGPQCGSELPSCTSVS